MGPTWKRGKGRKPTCKQSELKAQIELTGENTEHLRCLDSREEKHQRSMFGLIHAHGGVGMFTGDGKLGLEKELTGNKDDREGLTKD